MKIYTKTGDNGTTGLYFGGRVPKDDAQIHAVGAIDEAQAALGVARSLSHKTSELNSIIVSIQKDLWILMAEVGTKDENRHKLKPQESLVTSSMIQRLESMIDLTAEKFQMPNEFVIPGQTPIAASLDLARTVIRRAERCCISWNSNSNSLAPIYLNRLSDLVWALARWQEGDFLFSRSKENQ